MTLRQTLTDLAGRWGLDGADAELLAEQAVERGEAPALALLLEEAALAGGAGERALARRFGHALDEALRFDPLRDWQDEAFCNCDEEARGEALDGFDL